MFTFLIILALLILAFFIKYPHFINFLQFGLPKTDHYTAFPYKTIKALRPQLLQTSSIYPITIKNQQTLTQFKDYKTLAFLVIKNQHLLTEEYFNISFEEKINSFSASKSILSILIGIAIDQQAIKSLDQKVAPFFPELVLSEQLTIRHLLTMSSGLKWNENFLSPLSDVAIAYYTNNLWKQVKKTKSIYPPGQRFSYKCLNSILLGQIIERATNIPIYQFAEKYLWTPIGAEYNAFWTTDKYNITKTFCCLYATARDFAKIGLLLLNKGFYNNKQIVSKFYIEQMLTPATFLKDKNGDIVDYYGLHIWFTKFKGQIIPYIRAMHGQYVFILQKQNSIIVRLGQKRSLKMIDHTPDDVFIYLDAAWDIIHKT